MKRANERPDQMLKLLRGIAKLLPDMNITFTGHDVPWGTMSGESKEVHRKAAREGVCASFLSLPLARSDRKGPELTLLPLALQCCRTRRPTTTATTGSGTAGRASARPTRRCATSPRTTSAWRRATSTRRPRRAASSRTSSRRWTCATTPRTSSSTASLLGASLSLLLLDLVVSFDELR